MKPYRLFRTFSIVALFCLLMAGISMSTHAGYTKIRVPASQEYVYSSDKRPIIIFVGDSRTMMCTYPKGKQSARSNYVFCWVNGGNVSVIGNGGSLTSYVERMIRKYRDNCVVALNLGVNGNSNPQGNAGRIIQQYRRWMRKHPDVRFFVVSVNPTRIKTGPFANSKVIALNKRLKSEFEPEGIYIDTYSVLMESGLVTGSEKGMRDLAHYNWSAGKKILMTVRKYVSATLAQTIE